MIKEEKIYHIVCDNCGKNIEDDFSFWKIGSNDEIFVSFIGKNGKNSVSQCENLDFCSVKCVGNYFTKLCKDLS